VRATLFVHRGRPKELGLTSTAPRGRLFCNRNLGHEGQLSNGLLTQVEQESENRPRECSRLEEAHHRDRAKRCLELARHMSDPLAANLLRAAAPRHIERAAELENVGGCPSVSLPAIEG
jgi:exopolyphosphatase/pppGpp-phosphohydrolase